MPKKSTSKKRKSDTPSENAPSPKKSKKAPKEEEPEEEKEVIDASRSEKKPERNVRIRVSLHGQADIGFYLPSVVLAVGAPGLGKTHFGRYMLYQMAPYVTHGIIICTNPAAVDEWDCVPKKFVTRSYSRELLKAIMADQQANGFPLGFIYVDDFVGVIDLDDPEWRELCTQFRKYKLFVWFGAQYLARTVPPVIRQCAQYVYLFQTQEMRSVEVMHRSFLSGFFANPRTLAAALNNILPDKHHCLYLDIRERKLNVVIAPSPDDLPDFFITWESKPTEGDNEKEDMLAGAPHREGQLPDAWKRLDRDEANFGKTIDAFIGGQSNRLIR